MREASTSIPVFSKWQLCLAAGILVVGILLGRALFPIEVPKPFVVEKEKRVEVPVDRIVEKKVPVEVVKYVDRVVEKRVEVPVEKVVEKRVEVPVEKIVEKTVMVPVAKIVYVDRLLEKSGAGFTPGISAWRQLLKGLPRDQVRSMLGAPTRVLGGYPEVWEYGDSAHVTFFDGILHSWVEP